MELEKYIRQNYCFVVLRSPYELMSDPLCQEIYPKLIQLKTEGYRQEYEKHVLPFDSSDFIASHLLLCEYQKDGALIPVLGFKSVTLEKCDAHRISFPMLGMLEGSTSSKDNKDVILKLMNHYRDTLSTSRFAYNGSFTILPRLRENKELMKYLWDITFSLLTNYYIEYEIDHVVAICSTKFKVNVKKENLGWNYIQGEEGLLTPYPCHSLFDASFVPMELTNISVKGVEASSKFKDMWLNRITLDESVLTNKKKAA